MKTNSKLSMAVHSMILIYMLSNDMKVTGDSIAKSMQTNPVMVRRILSDLKRAGLIGITAGKGGTHALKRPEDVTLYDLFSAVEDEESSKIFGFHDCTKSRCPVTKNMHSVLDRYLDEAQEAVNKSLKETSMQDILDDIKTGQGVTKEKVLTALAG